MTDRAERGQSNPSPTTCQSERCDFPAVARNLCESIYLSRVEYLGSLFTDDAVLRGSQLGYLNGIGIRIAFFARPRRQDMARIDGIDI